MYEPRDHSRNMVPDQPGPSVSSFCNIYIHTYVNIILVAKCYYISVRQLESYCRIYSEDPAQDNEYIGSILNG